MEQIVRNRIVDWQTKLYLRLEEPTALVYGDDLNDCMMDSCNVIRDCVAGVDYASIIRGTYKTEQEAEDLIKSWGSITNYLTTRMGPPLEHVLQAHMGDLVVIEREGAEAVGIAMGMYAVFLRHPPRVGRLSVRLDQCSRAWST